MDSNSQPDALLSRWTLEGRIPLSGVAEGASWRRARSVATGQDVVLFIVQGETALEAADAVRRAYLVEDPHLLPVQDIVVLDDPRESGGEQSDAAPTHGPTTVVEYPLPPAPPLAALLARGPLHPETARAIIGEAATGLEAARRRGVRHQLIDSNRLFVDTRSGEVTVLGVGVEAAAHPGMDRSREIASFQDTAALVALLYRALTGRSPQHDADGEVPRPSTMVDTEIPEDLDLLCDLVLNESADDIPETTRGLIEVLEPWQSIPVTLEAYPRAGATAAATPVPVPVSSEPETQEQPASEEPTDVPSAESPAPAPSAEEPEELPDEDTEVRSPAPAAAETAELSAAGAAVGAAAAGAAVTSGQAEDVPEDDGAEAAAAEQKAAQEKAQRESAEAKTLVTDLKLDQRRSSTAFPGHLEITLPTPAAVPEPAPAQDSDAAGAGAAGAAAAGAAGAGAVAAGAAATQDPAPQEDTIPSRTSGTHWPLAREAEQGGASALAPDQSPEGSDGRAQRPAESPAPASPSATPSHTAATPAQPVVHSAGAQSPSPVAVTGRTVPVASARTDGPIVVHGRDRSLREEQEDDSPAYTSRSSLLRDVVGVAVDADAPETFALGPRDREKRSLQSQWIIIGGAIVVMVALVIALTSITRDLGGLLDDPLETSAPPTSAAPTEEDTGEAPVEPTEEATEEPELPAAELTGVELFAPNSDLEPDNADQQSRMHDGDPSTYWSSKHYASPHYGGLKEGVGVRLDFGEPSTFTGVMVTTALNNGGTIELRAVNDDGSLGDVLASGDLAGDGEVRLMAPEPLETERVALWISELPPDSNEQGRFRARIAEIQVE